MQKFVAVFKHRVTFADCDPAHLAYTPRIMEWFDWSAEHLWRSADLHWDRFFMKDGMGGLPLLDISVQFKYPCRFGDFVEIESWIDEFRAKTFTIRHKLWNATNGRRLGAESREVRTWARIDPAAPNGMRAAPVPDEVRRKFHFE